MTSRSEKLSLVNEERLADTLRYCPGCDPKAERPVACLPGQCACGQVLIVFTPWTQIVRGLPNG